MEKEFVPYEEALALRGLGFDEGCLMWYENDTSQLIGDYTRNSVEWFNNACASAPLYQQAFRWFREKYGLYPNVEYFSIAFEYGYYIRIPKEHKITNLNDEDMVKTYEEAELECLRKLIEITKTNK